MLASGDDHLRGGDPGDVVSPFIGPLDPDLLALQELAAVLARSDRRYLPERYLKADRAEALEDFARPKLRWLDACAPGLGG